MIKESARSPVNHSLACSDEVFHARSRIVSIGVEGNERRFGSLLSAPSPYPAMGRLGVLIRDGHSPEEIAKVRGEVKALALELRSTGS